MAYAIGSSLCDRAFRLEIQILNFIDLSLYLFSIYVSTLNSVATVTWEDFISHMPMFEKLADFKQLCAIKVLGVTYALICMGLAYVVSMFSGVIEISMFVNAATSGTLVGVFILAMLIPFANGKGASIGMIVSHTVIFALSVTSYLGKSMMQTEFLPTSTEVSS